MTGIDGTIIPGLWVAWLLYWIVAAASAKATQRDEPWGERMSHVLPLMIGGFLIGKPSLLGAAMAQRIMPATPAWQWIAIILVACGLGFAALARVWLGRNWSAMVTLKENHELIRSGPYALARHPIYTGILLALLGTALAIGAGSAIAGFALMIVAFVLKLRIEERFMAAQFGDAYARYRNDVAALVPFIL